jgi:hypothetical protein
MLLAMIGFRLRPRVLPPLARALIWSSVAVGVFGCDRSEAPTLSSVEDLYRAEQPAPCRYSSRSTSRESPWSDVNLTQTSYPCRLYFRETGVVLQGDSAGNSPYPDRYVARDSRGRFYSSIAGERTRIAIWNSDGSFERYFGSPGEGPGEVPHGNMPPLVFIDASDGLYIRTSGHRWTFFSDTLGYIGRAVAISTGHPSVNAVFHEARILTAISVGDPGSHYFRLDGPDGTVQREFPPIPDNRRDSDFLQGVLRTIVGVDETTFVASPETEDDGYALDLWSISGNRLASLRRTAPWFPTGPPPPATKPGQWFGPRVSPVSVDSAGLVLVYTIIRKDGGHNAHLEVLDWRGNAVVASEMVDGTAIWEERIPTYFFPRSNLGYRYDDTGDVPVVRIIEYGLTER